MIELEHWLKRDEFKNDYWSVKMLSFLAVFYEGLQDKLTQARDARAALDALREEHRDRLRREAEEAERQRQMQMAHKLEIMRKKKQEYLQYQRQVAMQRMQVTCLTEQTNGKFLLQRSFITIWDSFSLFMILICFIILELLFSGTVGFSVTLHPRSENDHFPDQKFKIKPVW